MRGAIPTGPLVALLATQVFFGSLAVAAKIALRDLAPFALVAARLVLATVFIVVVALFARRERVAARDLPKLAGLAVLGLVLNQLLFMAGLERTTAVSATILVATIPVFTFVLAAAFGAERLSGRKGVGVAVSFAGVVVLVGASALDGVGAHLVGDLLIVVNSLSYSAYLVLARPMLERYSTLTVVAWTFVFGSAITAVVASPQIAATPWTSLPLDLWLALLWIVLAATVAAYLLPTWALKRVPASTVAAFVYLQPLVAASLAIPILGERLGLHHVAGGALIVAGVFLVTRASRGEEPEPAAVLQTPRPPRPWRR